MNELIEHPCLRYPLRDLLQYRGSHRPPGPATGKMSKKQTVLWMKDTLYVTVESDIDLKLTAHFARSQQRLIVRSDVGHDLPQTQLPYANMRDQELPSTNVPGHCAELEHAPINDVNQSASTSTVALPSLPMAPGIHGHPPSQAITHEHLSWNPGSLFAFAPGSSSHWTTNIYASNPLAYVQPSATEPTTSRSAREESTMRQNCANPWGYAHAAWPNRPPHRDVQTDAFEAQSMQNGTSSTRFGEEFLQPMASCSRILSLPHPGPIASPDSRKRKRDSGSRQKDPRGKGQADASNESAGGPAPGCAGVSNTDLESRVGCPNPNCCYKDHVFNRAKDRLRHIRTHDPRIQYCCGFCLQIYKRPDSVRRHQYRKKTSTYQCEAILNATQGALNEWITYKEGNGSDVIPFVSIKAMEGEWEENLRFLDALVDRKKRAGIVNVARPIDVIGPLDCRVRMAEGVTMAAIGNGAFQATEDMTESGGDDRQRKKARTSE
ncbi:hypothetical protein OF83DRAFT_929253 [Amylostereum chailletii]|nr:hypothetical protein OF83DRAFT_929253 [Amylostereum chailletii]